MEFKPVNDAQTEKALIYDRVANIVAVAGPIRALLGSPNDLEDEAADFAADLVDRMYDIAEDGTQFKSYPHFAPTHLAPVPDGTTVAPDNMDAPARYEVIKTRMVTNPEPPPAEIEERYLDAGPTLAEMLADTPWPTMAMMFSGKVDCADGRTRGNMERQSFILRATVEVAGTVYFFDVGVGWMGDENTRTYYEIVDTA